MYSYVEGSFIAYASRQLKKDEQDYATHDLELVSCRVCAKDLDALSLW